MAIYNIGLLDEHKIMSMESWSIATPKKVRLGKMLPK
jgi:hypothetical protein